MQIFYVGNGNYKHFGARYYDVGRKLANGFIRNGHNLYFMSDRDTARASNLFGSRKCGIRACNQAFLKICQNFKPDLILLGHADIISTESLTHARKVLPEVKIAQFNVDSIFNPHTARQIADNAALCDASFVTTGGVALERFSTSGGRVAFMPNPVDSSIEYVRSHEHSDQAFDIFWALRAMDGSYAGDPRIEYPLYLEQSGDVEIDYHGMRGKPPVFGAAYYQHIANARMGLNISNMSYRENPSRASSEQLYLYASDRLSHYMGCGLLTFTPRDYRLEELFNEDEEMIFFQGKEELLEKVVYYKRHDDKRKAIAAAGWRKSHERLNERLVARYIEEVTFDVPLSSDYAWPAVIY